MTMNLDQIGSARRGDRFEQIISFLISFSSAHSIIITIHCVLGDPQAIKILNRATK